MIHIGDTVILKESPSCTYGIHLKMLEPLIGQTLYVKDFRLSGGLEYIQVRTQLGELKGFFPAKFFSILTESGLIIEPQKMTQTEKILKHMEQYGKITPIEAMQEYGIMRLASRISDLKKAGYKIKKGVCTSTNRYGEKVYFAEYSLEE